MDARTLCFTPASELAALIRDKAVSPVEVVNAVLDRIEAAQPHLNAFITVCGERALEEAQAAEARAMAGGNLPPLLGVPFSAKDLLNSAGVATTFGSRVLADNVPAEDGLAIARMRAAGAILVGKTTTPEFGHKPMTEGPLFGRTCNAWSAAHTSGGSSGGAAVAVAAGLAPLALGTDGGGSTRIPAACNGVVGVKATLGMVPHDQAADAFANLAYIGPITRGVADAVLAMSVLAGSHPVDPYSQSLPQMDWSAEPLPLQGLRIGLFERLGNAAVDPAVLAALAGTAAALRDLGATVTAVEEDFANTEPHWLVITHSIWASRFREMIARHGDIMDATLKAQTALGEGHGAVALQDAARARTALFRQVQGWFTAHDFVLTPTLARTAVPIDQDALGQVEINGAPAGSLRGAWYPYTHPFNMTGHPALTLPAGFDAAGLPLAVQLVGPWHADDRLLRLAAAVEQARPWAGRTPQDRW